MGFLLLQGGGYLEFESGGFLILNDVTEGFRFSTFPPSGPTVVQNVIPSYLYVQYQDDDDLQAFVASYNALAQEYVTWFATIGLPVYTGLSAPLLDWVAEGLYGIKRPALTSGPSDAVGPFNTLTLNSEVFNYLDGNPAPEFTQTNDDTFKRIITWAFWKGDGRVFNTRWLKRRVARFLTGNDGTGGVTDQTYDVSVEIAGTSVTIALDGYLATGPMAVLFQQAVDSGALELPFQYDWSVQIGPPVYAPETLAIIAEFTTPPDEATTEAINNKVLALISAGLWAKMDAFYQFKGAQDAQAAGINWIDPSGPQILPVGAPVWSSATGYTGDGVDDYLNTQLVMNALTHLTQDSASAFAWVTASGSVATHALWGKATDGFRASLTSGGNVNGRINDAANINMVGVAVSQPGVYALNRSGATARQAYKDGAPIISDTQASTALTAEEFWIMRLVSSYGTLPIGGAGIGGSMDASEQADLYNIIIS